MHSGRNLARRPSTLQTWPDKQYWRVSKGDIHDATKRKKRRAEHGNGKRAAQTPPFVLRPANHPTIHKIASLLQYALTSSSAPPEYSSRPAEQRSIRATEPDRRVVAAAVLHWHSHRCDGTAGEQRLPNPSSSHPHSLRIRKTDCTVDVDNSGAVKLSRDRNA